MFREVKLLMQKHWETTRVVLLIGIAIGILFVLSFQQFKSSGLPTAHLICTGQEQSKPFALFIGGHSWKEEEFESSIDSLFAFNSTTIIEQVPVDDWMETIFIYFSKPPTQIQIIRFDGKWINNYPSWDDGTIVEISKQKKGYAFEEFVPGQIYIARCSWSENFIEYAWQFS